MMMPAITTGMARRLPNRRVLRRLKSPAMIEMLNPFNKTQSNYPNSLSYRDEI
jgi:hypothetical protein